MTIMKIISHQNYIIKIPKLFNGYEINDYIGKGSTSTLFKVKKIKTNEIFAAKVIPKKYIQIEHINKEIAIMSQINHPNIVKFYESFEIQNKINDQYIVIIIEYCENGSLCNFIKNKKYQNLSQNQKDTIIKGFLESILYLHNRGIAHCDIKLDNILIDSKLNAKLCDFGFCQTEPIADDESKYGTLLYAPPEFFIKGDFWTYKADIWEIGITLYCISESSFPYDNGDKNFIINQIISHQLKFKSCLPEGLKKIIEKCTNMNAENRPTVAEILNDQFFSWNQEIPNKTQKLNNFDLLKMNRAIKKTNSTNKKYQSDEILINYPNDMVD